MSEYCTGYIDEDLGLLYVDYWETEDYNEKSKVIAKINIHSLEVLYDDESHKDNPRTQAIINEAKEELKTRCKYILICLDDSYPLQYFLSLKDVRSWLFNHARLQLEIQGDCRDPKDIGHDVNLKLLDTYELAEYFDFTLETNVKLNK